MDELKISALMASSMATSQLAGQMYDVPLVYDSVRDLASSDEVDLVAVTLRVDKHASAVEAAIGAGKPVFCEWPLGKSLDEARRLEGLARSANITTFVGLQALASPLIRYLSDLIAEGYLGRVVSSSLIAAGGDWGPTFEPRGEYKLDADSGGTMITIPVAHVLSAACRVLGDFSSLNAWSAVRYPTVTNSADGTSRPKTAADQLAVTGTVGQGAVLNAHFRGGASRASNFHWEINGSDGDLVLTSDVPHFWIGPASLAGARKEETGLTPLPVPARYESRLPSLSDLAGQPAYNVAFAYGDIIDDLKLGTNRAPTFSDALALHELIARIEESARTGQRT
jgi:predicted dehydrogenase